MKRRHLLVAPIFIFGLGCIFIFTGMEHAIVADLHSSSIQTKTNSYVQIPWMRNSVQELKGWSEVADHPAEQTVEATTTALLSPAETDDHADDHDAETDDHGEESSLFGSLEEITGKMLLMGILVVVGAVLCLESIFHGLHAFTHETPFNDVITAIEKELMVVGCTAFILKIVINTQSSLSHDFYFALEFADLLVPIFSFANCFISMALILMSLRQCEAWRRSYHLKLEELLDEFVREDGNYFFMKLFAPFSQLVNEMEFRVFHNVFCETYRIQRKAFAFDEYMSLVYETFSLTIIEMGVINWLIFIFLMLVTMININNNNSILKCEDNENHTENTNCVQDRGIILFNVFGAGLFALFLFMAVLSRHYERNFMRARGLHNIEDYPLFLKKMEEIEYTTVESKRLTEQQLKAAVKSSTFGDRHNHHYMAKFMNKVVNGVHYVMEATHSSKIKPEKDEDRIELPLQSAIAQSVKMGKSFKGNNNDIRSKSESDAALRANAVQDFDDSHSSLFEKKEDDNRKNNMSDIESFRKEGDCNIEELSSKKVSLPPLEGSLSTKLDHNAINHSPGPLCTTDIEGSNKQDDTIVHLSKFGASAQSRVHRESIKEAFNSFVHDQAAANHSDAPVCCPELDDQALPNIVARKESSILKKAALLFKDIFTPKRSGQMDNIFWLSSPSLYFSVVRYLPIPLSIYIALWLVNFGVSDAKSIYKFLSALPAAFNLFCYLYTVKSAAMLKAITHVDRDAVLEVLEQTEGSRLLGETIREKLLSKLDLMGDPYTELRQLFWQIDSDGSNRLSRLDFELLMDKLDINFSRRKWKQIYREIDRNYDDQVSFQEFFFFLFPTHDVSLALEKRRMKIIKKRLAAKTMISAGKNRRKNSFLYSLTENKSSSMQLASATAVSYTENAEEHAESPV